MLGNSACLQRVAQSLGVGLLFQNSSGLQFVPLTFPCELKLRFVIYLSTFATLHTNHSGDPIARLAANLRLGANIWWEATREVCIRAQVSVSRNCCDNLCSELSSLLGVSCKFDPYE